MLQNSADAAALAVSVDCAECINSGDCGPYEDNADTFADTNKRRVAFVESVTGPTGDALNPAAGSVTVLTRTGTTDAPGRLP